MRPTVLANGQIQEFYFLDDHPQYPGFFKGMEQIIREWGLWPATETLLAQCEGFKCEPGMTNCCCQWLLFTQPDFVDQKSQLEELITSRGHICDFYPKYHCELSNTGGLSNSAFMISILSWQHLRKWRKECSSV